MVRKLVVLLSLSLFYSQITVSGTNHIIDYKPSKINIYEKHKTSYWHTPILAPIYLNNGSCEKRINYFESSSKVFITQSTRNFDYVITTTSIGTKKNNVFNGFYQFYIFDNHKSYRKNLKEWKLHDIGVKRNQRCRGDISDIKKKPGRTYYSDFNNDGLTDLLYLTKNKAFHQKALIFYGRELDNLNLKKHVNGHSFLTSGHLHRKEVEKNNQGPKVLDISHFTGDWSNVTITILDRNKDGFKDLLITRPNAPDLIAFTGSNGYFSKTEVDTGIGKYNGPSLYKSRFCNRALLTQHPDENPSTVLFDDICRTAYVSPPATGTTEVTALTPATDNAAFCPKLTATQTEQTELLKELGQANTKFKTIMGSLLHDTQLMTYATTREQAFNDLLAAEQAEAAVRKTVLSQRRTIGQLELDVEDCALLGTDCNTAQHQLNAAQQALTQLLTELDAAVEARLVKQQLYDQAFDAYGEALDAYLTVDTELAALFEEFKALQDKELALYREFAGLEGATAQIQYQWDWAEQVNRYKQLNQLLKMQWQPLPVTGTKILAELQEKPETPLGDKAITLPAVLYTSIDDQAANVKINGYETTLMPKGDTVITSTLRKGPSNTINLPSKINGTIGLSLAGYCPFAPSANQPQPVENLAAHLTPHIQYEYEEQIKRGYTAKYKLDTFVKTIVRTEKKRKWFKKKKKTYIVRKFITSDWFNIQFDATSGEYAYSPAEQDQITREVKSDLVRRVNTAIGALYADNSQCQQNKDCSYGYWLGQLTGNNDDTKAIQQFKQGNSKWVEEVVYGIRYRPKTGWVGFR
ncbi:hypothetical protein [Spartinivicinus ruber]|uniref:hypothetical protein n=1 Tax=Spartinivicinus ruber TaxID=2683272 RepID=UPI0013D81FE2|nr:hypothetical protein [Spartinivicinus ruber]